MYPFPPIHYLVYMLYFHLYAHNCVTALPEPLCHDFFPVLHSLARIYLIFFYHKLLFTFPASDLHPRLSPPFTCSFLGSFWSSAFWAFHIAIFSISLPMFRNISHFFLMKALSPSSKTQFLLSRLQYFYNNDIFSIRW